MEEALQKILSGSDASPQETTEIMNAIMSGKLTDDRIASFLLALRKKGETIDEITASAQVMRKKATTIKPKHQDKLIDIVGTGGDNTNTFNISTATAFVVAACDVPVAKHGNKSVSSKSGAADVLQALGINIDLEPKKVEQCINEVGIGFMFAPNFHPAMKYAIGARKKLGVRTIFNILGPLTNPASAPYELMGVFEKNLVTPLAHVLNNLGVKHAMVVHGSGMDEITITGPTTIAEVNEGKVSETTLTPESLGVKQTTLAELQGNGPEENAKIIMDIFEGKDKGPKRDIVVVNAAAALYLVGKSPSIKEAMPLAEQAIDSGKALAKLNKLKEWTTH